MARREIGGLEWARLVGKPGRDDLREVIKRGYRVVYLVTEEQVEIVTVRSSPTPLADQRRPLEGI